MSKAQTYVLAKDGRRFIFPGLVDYFDDTLNVKGYRPLITEIWGQALSFSMALHAKLEPELLEFNTEDFVHVPMEIGSSAFRHGSAIVWMIAGPEFDEATKEAL